MWPLSSSPDYNLLNEWMLNFHLEYEYDLHPWSLLFDSGTNTMAVLLLGSDIRLDMRFPKLMFILFPTSLILVDSRALNILSLLFSMSYSRPIWRHGKIWFWILALPFTHYVTVSRLFKLFKISAHQTCRSRWHNELKFLSHSGELLNASFLPLYL